MKILKENPTVSLKYENYVDFEALKENFNFITKSLVTEGIKISDVPRYAACKCKDDCKSGVGCCSSRRNSKLAYNLNKCLSRLGNTNLPIYECNKYCKCGPNCINRVVQLGSKTSLCLFKTSNGKGLGIKSLESIRRGQFICEYIGEIIDFKESERRGQHYIAKDTHYMFSMDFYPSNKPYSIDATNYGNESRFINHSCKPNCSVYSVWYGSISINFPKLAFFSIR